MSYFQSLKTDIILFLGISRDTIHLYIGFLSLLLSFFFFKKISSYKTLILGLIISVLLESIDLSDDMAAYGFPRWGASLHDVFNTNLLPFLFVTVLKIRNNKTTS